MLAKINGYEVKTNTLIVGLMRADESGPAPDSSGSQLLKGFNHNQPHGGVKKELLSTCSHTLACIFVKNLH